MASPKPLDMNQYEVVGPAEPLDPGNFEEVEAKKPLSRARAAQSTLIGQGSFLGFGDEMKGVDRAAAHVLKESVLKGRLPSLAEIKGVYTQARDTERSVVAEAHREFPKQSFATELAGGILTPLPGLGTAGAGVRTATGLGAKALSAARAVAPAAVMGGVAGVGFQNSGEGKIADVGSLAEAGAKGAAAGAAVGTGVALVGKGLKTVVGRSPEKIKAGILDQISRADDGAAKATPTAQKRLKKAANAIYDEVVKGPEAEGVLKVVQAPKAAKGMEWLEPILTRANAKKNAGYKAFDKAGKGNVDMADYLMRLNDAQMKARVAGDARLADGLDGIIAKLDSEAVRTHGAGGETSLKWLRKHMTSYQDAAASKLGSLNEHERFRVATSIAQKAKEVFDDTLTATAGKNPKLQAAAAQIRRQNRRLFGLLSLKGGLESRAQKEAVEGGALERAARALASPRGVAAGGLGALASGGAAIPSLAAAGIAAAAPTLARKADRAITAAQIARIRDAARLKKGQQGITTLADELGMSERLIRPLYIRALLEERSQPQETE